MSRSRKGPPLPKNAAAALLAPYAAHLRKVAIALRATDVPKWEGLVTAAEILDEARAVNVELPQLDDAQMEKVERFVHLLQDARALLHGLGADVVRLLAVAGDEPKPLPTRTWTPSTTDIEQPAKILEMLKKGPVEVSQTAAEKVLEHLYTPSDVRATPNGVTQREMLERGQGGVVRIHTEPRSEVLDLKLSKCERALLHVLAMRSPQPTTRTQLGLLADYSPESGTFANALGALRRLELAGDGGGGAPMIYATVEGLERAKPYTPMPKRGAKLREWWLAGGGFPYKLGKCERSLFRVFVDLRQVGHAPSREELGHRSGYSPESGTFANALGRLRTLELVRGMRLADDLQG